MDTYDFATLVPRSRLSFLSYSLKRFFGGSVAAVVVDALSERPTLLLFRGAPAFFCLALFLAMLLVLL